MTDLNLYSKEQIDTKIEAIDSEIEMINTEMETKQDTLISGTNIKTINGNSILGEGDIEITGTQLKYITFSGAPEATVFQDTDIVIVNAMTVNSVVHQGLYVYNSANSTLISMGPTEVGGNVTIDDVVNVSTITLFAGWIIRS